MLKESHVHNSVYYCKFSKNSASLFIRHPFSNNEEWQLRFYQTYVTAGNHCQVTIVKLRIPNLVYTSVESQQDRDTTTTTTADSSDIKYMELNILNHQTYPGLNNNGLLLKVKKLNEVAKYIADSSNYFNTDFISNNYSLITSEILAR